MWACAAPMTHRRRRGPASLLGKTPIGLEFVLRRRTAPCRVCLLIRLGRRAGGKRPPAVITRRSPLKLTRIVVDCCLCVLLVTVLWRYFSGPRVASISDPGPDVAPLTLGSTLTGLDVDWSVATRHVVLRLMTKCPACNTSLPLYRELGERRRAWGVNLVVVTNEERSAMAAWLKSASIEVDEIVTSSAPAQLGFVLAPTVLIVDSTGRVTDALLERLDEGQVAALMNRLGGRSSAALDNTNFPAEIDEADLRRRRELGQLVSVIDTSERDGAEANQGPAPALRIPRDELRVRASLELPPGGTVAILCKRPQSRQQCRLDGRTLSALGRFEVLLLADR